MQKRVSPYEIRGYERFTAASFFVGAETFGRMGKIAWGLTAFSGAPGRVEADIRTGSGHGGRPTLLNSCSFADIDGSGPGL
jgi:hypothetical protein